MSAPTESSGGSTRELDPRVSLDDAIEVQRTMQSVRGALFDVPVEQPRIGRFVVRRLAGEGAMGRVYEAWDETLDRPVALKLIAVEHSEGEGADRHRRRLLREAKALARTNHPNVIEVYEVGTYEGDVFIAMEFMQGVSLRQWLNAQPRKWPEIQRVFADAARGLAAAHQAGLVHRDFKPDNVLVGQGGVDGEETAGRVRVVDFGLATTPRGPAPGRYEVTLDDHTATGSSVIAGTPAYMAPEQRLGQTVDARSDQFSFGVALHEALYGARPFRPPLYEELEPASLSGSVGPVPSRVLVAVQRTLSNDPTDRFASMDDVVAELTFDPSLRRSRIVTATLGVACLTCVAVILAMADGDEPAADRCTGISEHFASVWGSDRRQEVRDAFASTGLGYARDVVGSVVNEIDVYTKAWLGAKLDACRREPATEDAQARMLELRNNACLHERRQQLEAVVDLLARADAGTVERAPQLVASLEPIAPCLDPDALMAGPALPDAAIAEQVDAVREALAEAMALFHAGRTAESLEVARAAVEAADASGHGPVRAEARHWVGVVMNELGRFDDAEPVLLEGLELAEGHAHDDVKLRIWIELSDLALTQDDRTRADLYTRNAAATSTRLGSPKRFEITVARHRSRLRLAADDTEGARDELTRALELLGSDGSPVTVGAVQLDLGNAWYRMGDYDKADEAFTRALQAYESALGEEHPNLARALTNVGVNRIRQGDPDAAIEPLQRAVAIRRKASGGDSPSVVSSINALASAHYSRGAYEDALALYEEALRIETVGAGPDSTRVLAPLANKGRTLSLLGRHGEALATLQDALELAIQVYGRDHSQAAELHGALASALGQAKRTTEARAHARSAYEIRLRALGSDHVLTHASRSALADRLLDAKRAREAEPLAEEALAGLDQLLGPSHPEVAQALITAGRVDLALGRAARARDRLERAVTMLDAIEGHPQRLAQAKLELARAHQAPE